MMMTTIIVVISVCLLMAIAMIIGFSISGEVGAIISVISLVATVVILISYTFISRKIFKDWTNYYSKVNNGFDGLAEQEINRLKPNNNDELLIKKYRKKSLIYGLIFLLTLVIEFSIILALDISIHSPITIIITIIITVVWYVFEDTCSVEIRRIKSGYYKRSFGFVCEKCKNQVLIKFNNIEKYKDAPRNENGIRVISCPNCNNLVPFYNFDTTYNDYKKYKEQTK